MDPDPVSMTLFDDFYRSLGEYDHLDLKVEAIPLITGIVEYFRRSAGGASKENIPEDCAMFLRAHILESAMAKIYWSIATTGPTSTSIVEEFGGASEKTKFAMVSSEITKLGTMPFPEICNAVAQSAGFFLHEAHFKELSIILPVFILNCSADHFSAAIKLILAFPRDTSGKFFRLIVLNAPTSLGRIVDIVTGVLKQINNDPTMEWKFARVLLSTVADQSLDVSKKLRTELANRMIFPSLCLELTCEHIYDLQYFLDTVITGSHDLGRWIICKVQDDFLEYSVEFCLMGITSICKQFSNEPTPYRSTELETFIRVICCILLVASDDRRFLHFSVERSAIITSSEIPSKDERIPLVSTSSFFRCLAFLLVVCDEPGTDLEFKESILRVVFILSLVRLYSIQPITSTDENKVKKQAEVQNIAIIIKLSLRTLRCQGDSLLYCFYGSLLLKAPFDKEILQKTFSRELNISVFPNQSSLESLLPLHKISAGLLALERYFHSPGSQEISDLKSYIVKTVLSVSVPELISGQNEFVGDWLSCLEVIMRDSQFSISTEIHSVHSIAVAVIMACRQPLHISVLGFLSAWIRRCMVSRSRAFDIGYSLLPDEIESFIVPLKNVLGKGVDITRKHALKRTKSVPDQYIHTVCRDVILANEDLLPPTLACYCALLQLQILDSLGNDVTDVLVVNPRKLPLRSALSFIESCSEANANGLNYRNNLSMNELKSEFVKYVESLCPELFLVDLYDIQDQNLIQHVNSCGSDLDCINDLLSTLLYTRVGISDIFKSKKKRTLSYLDFSIESFGVSVIAAVLKKSFAGVLDSGVQDYLFDIFQILHSKSICPHQFELLIINFIIDEANGCFFENTQGVNGLGSNADYALRHIPSYDALVREPILIFRLPDVALQHPFLLRVVLFILKSVLIISRFEVTKIARLQKYGGLRTDNQDPQQSAFYIHVQDIIVIRALLEFGAEINRQESISRIISRQISDLIISFIDNHMSNSQNGFENLAIYRSILVHGIENYYAFSILFSKPNLALNFSTAIFEDIKHFCAVMPMPSRFWLRTPQERSAIFQVSEKFTVENNGSPRQHTFGILRHLTFLLRVPFVSAEVEVMRGSIASSIPGFVIGLLSMMEAPYLFDDVVQACLEVVNCLKPKTSEMSALGAAAIEDHKAIQYPDVWLQLMDMLQNVKGEDQSSLKKFAYTVFSVEQSYHAFQPNLHLKEAEKFAVIEEYGKIYTADVAWSALHPALK